MVTWLDILPYDLSEYIHKLVVYKDNKENNYKELEESLIYKKHFYDMVYSQSDLNFLNLKNIIQGHFKYNTLSILTNYISDLVSNVISIKSDAKFLSTTTCLQEDKQKFYDEYNKEICYTKCYFYSAVKILNIYHHKNYKDPLVHFIIRSYIQID